MITDRDLVDVTINIFGKPWETALSVLSLVARSGERLGVLHLQYEPYGSMYDSLDPLLLPRYVREELGRPCVLHQPEYWLARGVPEPARMHEEAYRMGIRYQAAFEKSEARYLLLLHNDVFIHHDLIGALLDRAGQAEQEHGRPPFAVGSVGQCWNCPAARADLMAELFDSPACGSRNFETFRAFFAGPDGAKRLHILYDTALHRGLLARSYDDFTRCSWPLPECRVNEWACLVDRYLTRDLTVPLGDAPAPGAYAPCGDWTAAIHPDEIMLDVGSGWFQAMYAHGLYAAHIQVYDFMRHWGGTGKKTERKYRQIEDNARYLLERHFPAFIRWLADKGALPVR